MAHDGDGRQGGGVLGHPPLRIGAGDVELVRLAEEDWPLEVALSATPDVPRWTMYPPDLDEAAARARIVRSTADPQVAARYLVRRDGTAAGTAGLTARLRGVPEVFYALLPSARGRGTATAAVVALTGWAHRAGHDLVLLLTLPGNEASEAVARRAGFVPVGPEAAPDGVVLHRWEHRPAARPGERPSVTATRRGRCR